MTLQLVNVATTPYQNQKPGTSGLRKKVSEFKQLNYLENFIQSIFSCFETLKGATLLVSGDGRYYSDIAIKKIAEIAAGNGVSRLWVGKNGLVSTPAASAIIRNRENGICFGGILLTASHNPGGIEGDFGIKYNSENGGPANEALTDKIYANTLNIKSYKKIVNLPDINLNELGIFELSENFTIEVIDPVEDWLKLMREIFDMSKIRNFITQRKDFRMVYDALHGVAGIYAQEVFVNELGADSSCLMNCKPLQDFGGGHPDPNLSYAKDLVKVMKIFNHHDDEISDESTPKFGAAGDGDADRNMIMGSGFFVTPSDSVAVIAAHAESCIPYFRSGLKGLARSMPTSCALDNVARKKKLNCYEVPTGWKFFGNLMDSNKLSICGEESFGTGSDHIREKDGLWAVLAWLSILAHHNQDSNSQLVDIRSLVEGFWKSYGRNYYMRYDYEEVDATKANNMMARLRSFVSTSAQNPQSKGISAEKCLPPEISRLLVTHKFMIQNIDEFAYEDPVDLSVSEQQGIRFLLIDGSRIIVRLSGTGSVGATIRIYLEKFEQKRIDLSAQEALKDLSTVALALCQIKQEFNRDTPTVIT